MRALAPSLSSLPKVVVEAVPMLLRLNTGRSRLWRVECRPDFGGWNVGPTFEGGMFGPTLEGRMSARHWRVECRPDIGGWNVGPTLEGGMSTRHWRVECRPLPFSTLCFLQTISAVVLWPVHVQKVPQASTHLPTLPSCRLDVMTAALASLSARLFPLTVAQPGQQIHGHPSRRSRRLCVVLPQSGQPRAPDYAKNRRICATNP